MAENLKGLRAAVLTVSDSAASGRRKDESGPRLCRLLEKLGARVAAAAVVPDEAGRFVSRCRRWAQSGRIDLILSTGGTGLGPRDVTPEATRRLIEKEAPGVPELMRWKNFAKNRRAALSRGVAGIYKKTLIVNLPGSPKGASESFLAVADIIPHALAMIRGEGH